MSYVSAMLTCTNRISWNVPLDDRSSLRTWALVSQGGIHPRPKGHVNKLIVFDFLNKT